MGHVPGAGDIESKYEYWINFGIARERERILALLNAKDEWHYAFSDVSDVIALIKGEKE